MPQQKDHFDQVNRNLHFLSQINSIKNCWDWQVTTCFYAAVHLANGHLAKFDMHYRKHSDVNLALDTNTITSVAKLPEREWAAYYKLYELSRMSRYLVSDTFKNVKETERAFLTYDKHLAKSIRHLDILISYFTLIYKVNFKKPTIKCPSLDKAEPIANFILMP
jgi:hypothetical protein